MTNANFASQTIWTGDNLDIMRGMNSDSVDLIYLDPPFNSKANYAAPIGSKAAGAAFKDTWGLDDVNLVWHGEIKLEYPGLYALLTTTREIHGDSMMSYLIYMSIRIMEMRRLLKPNGSIYLHCDPTASHYLKLLMDAVFGRKAFRNEISWQRYAPHSLATSRFDGNSDSILFYAAGGRFTPQYQKLTESELKKRFPHTEKETGRKYQHVALEQSSNRASAGEVRVINGKELVSEIGWRWTQKTFDARLAENPHMIHWTSGGRPRYKIYADGYKGKPLGSIWTDVTPLTAGSKERTGYPTQKPLALLYRVVKASSNEGDMVLDPFCGCATTCVAAEQLGRQWVGIEISEKAADLVQSRLREEVGLTYQGAHRTDIPKRTDLGKIPRYNSAENRRYLYGEQGGYCNGCETHFEPRHFHVDHIVPRAKGGNDHISNLQLLCPSCNAHKGKKSHEELTILLTDKGWIKRRQEIIAKGNFNQPAANG